ncbi:E3 ubiquitin-protein ligase RNF139 isoform X2 [Takifugu rubripes]|uniref:E3 ubiquitin-protein ligase RNF139 n=1 Tax=Takifugu rubripes TaxID=31033 RepID=H2SB40_TAKRU|nr:E3 ubiquitin-protein ligase RNF139 isoform X2 [Takifugu rubripes]XP_056877202.1 E3 ubiquitin-protein ligase RNF139 isoform X2 [Takifugu flavidus]|eukprot:XP_011615147.1 PREDICTED: E3 ubiquitin-protein ligase RNF139 isoform X2 [Takifugu rubripes]
MATAQARIGHQVFVVLDVVLRVPCIFILDAIFNSHYDAGSGWAGSVAKLAIRITGVFISSVVLLLSQKALFKFYTLFCAALLGMAAVLFNYYATSHSDIYSYYYNAALGFHLLPKNASTLWMGMAVVQLIFGLGYIFLLNVQSLFAAVVVLDIMIPLWTLMIELPVDVRQLVATLSGLLLALNTAVCLAMKLKCFYYSCRYVYLLVRHMYRIYGLQLLLEDTWKRIRFPDVLRVFWLSRITAQGMILVYVVQVARQESSKTTGGTMDGSSHSQGYMSNWEVLWDLTSNLIISGCDSTLTVLGMSAVISSVAHYLGLSILAFIGSTEEEDKRLGFVAPVLFFILALQTGLSGLDPEERLVRLSRNMCLLLTAILHFIHGMTDPVLMSLSASHVSSVRRHFPVLLVSMALFVLPVVLSYSLWHHYALNTWLFAVTAFCVELCLKVVVSLTVYGLFMVDGFSNVLWEKLDDYVYYVRSTGNIIEFLFGVIMFGNGAYTMMFESGSKIRACMMCLHAYFNIYLQAKNGWKTFINRRTAVKKINSLPEVYGDQLRDIDDVCAICYQEFSSSARITPCHHYFHTLCLRKWLYIQDTCPMCHQRVYVEEENRERATNSNNNGGYAEPQDAAVADPPAPGNNQYGQQAVLLPADGALAGIQAVAGQVELDNELLEDNDSIEYDEEEWGTQNGGTLLEEDYINDDTDTTED